MQTLDADSPIFSDAGPTDVFDAYPAPTFIVDDDLRLLRLNRAARAALGEAQGATPLLLQRGGTVLRCVNAMAERGCGNQPACRQCVLRSSVQQALTTGVVHREQTFLAVERDGSPFDVCVLVTASPYVGGTAVLTLEDAADVHRKEEVRRREQPPRPTEGDLSALELGDVLDLDALRSMMEEFNKLTRIPMAIIDARGNVLVGVGWQDICTKFHRVHPETCRHCVESDTTLTAGLRPGEIRRYRCQNSMWDVATPIVIGGERAGNLFMGQFFFDDEPIEYGAFREQAAQYGFDEGDYLAALEAVPRLNREAVAAAMQFFLKFAGMLSSSSYASLKLARAVAEREKLMASLRESKERLEETDRRKDEFIAVLSHELRNPLAPIRTSLHLLERADPAGPQAARARAVMNRQVTHLTRLVDDLLDVTRISHGKIVLSRERIDLRDVVRRTCDDGRAAFEDRAIGFGVELPTGPIPVDADPTRVAQVVGNLVQNAAKFTPSGGKVVVAVSSGDGRAEVSVRDTGVGLQASELERVFEPFTQAEQGLARTHGGLGLGLALVKSLVELHGGSVEARSEGPGRGAEFVIRLPLAPPPAGALS